MSHVATARGGGRAGVAGSPASTSSLGRRQAAVQDGARTGTASSSSPSCRLRSQEAVAASLGDPECVLDRASGLAVPRDATTGGSRRAPSTLLFDDRATTAPAPRSCPPPPSTEVRRRAGTRCASLTASTAGEATGRAPRHQRGPRTAAAGPAHASGRESTRRRRGERASAGAAAALFFIFQIH